jgi:glycosyltransferase involved in cell wall biosynthesis
MWERYDNIISISDNVTESFVKTFPSLEDKIVMIENIMPMKYMRELAAAFSAEEEIPQNSINLLTIGRFSYPKRMDEIPQICKRIRESGIDAKWYLIGFGGDEALIRQRIAEAGAEDFVIILGKKENPYPYIKACDIYIQPSRYEGKSVAVREAQILGKPVIITNYATAASQLNDVIDGVIVPMDIDACADGIIKVIKNKELQEKLVENTKKTDYTNASEINKLYSIVEEC